MSFSKLSKSHRGRRVKVTCSRVNPPVEVSDEAAALPVNPLTPATSTASLPAETDSGLQDSDDVRPSSSATNSSRESFYSYREPKAEYASDDNQDPDSPPRIIARPESPDFHFPDPVRDPPPSPPRLPPAILAPQVAPQMARYVNWDTDACEELRYLQRRHKYCRIDDFMDFVETHQASAFFVHAVRVNIVNACRGLRRRAPFAATTRFPDEEYIDLDHPDIIPHMMTIMTACEQPDRQNNLPAGGAAPNGNVHASLNDAKRAFDVAFKHLTMVLKETRPDQMLQHGIFDRRSFERYFGLIWGGAPAVVPVPPAPLPPAGN